MWLYISMGKFNTYFLTIIHSKWYIAIEIYVVRGCWYSTWPNGEKLRASVCSDEFNSLAPRKFEWNFRYLILQIISVIDGWAISCELALRWTSLDLTRDKSALVHVMARCHQATSHYLSQCSPRSLSPHGVTRPQWVNLFFIFVRFCTLSDFP